MGREVIAALAKETELDLAGGSLRVPVKSTLDLPGGGGLIRSAATSNDHQSVRPRVMIDFTRPDVAMGNVRIALKNKVSPVVALAVSGGRPRRDRGADREAGVGAVVVPNFAIGAN